MNFDGRTNQCNNWEYILYERACVQLCSIFTFTSNWWLSAAYNQVCVLPSECAWPPTCADTNRRLSLALQLCCIRWTSVGNLLAPVSGYSAAGLLHLFLRYTDSALACSPQSKREETGGRNPIKFLTVNLATCWEMNVLRYCGITGMRLIKEELGERAAQPGFSFSVTSQWKEQKEGKEVFRLFLLSPFGLMRRIIYLNLHQKAFSLLDG